MITYSYGNVWVSHTFKYVFSYNGIGEVRINSTKVKDYRWEKYEYDIKKYKIIYRILYKEVNNE